MSSSISRLKHEFYAVIPAAIFFFIAFQLLAFSRALILKEYGIQVSTFFAATIAALIVAKVVLVVDLFPFVNRFPERPLIYNVIWKTIIYLVATLIVRYIEHLVPFVHQYSDIALAHHHLVDKVVWPHFWLVQIWLLVYFLMFCALRELVRVLGRERVRTIFLGPMRANVP
jgi:chromate transport protein ChrA